MYNYALITNALLGGGFFFGYSCAVLNTSEDKIATRFNWNEMEQNKYISLSNILFPLCAFVGCMTGG